MINIYSQEILENIDVYPSQGVFKKVYSLPLALFNSCFNVLFDGQYIDPENEEGILNLISHN